jgi:hypothetical protein
MTRGRVGSLGCLVAGLLVIWGGDGAPRAAEPVAPASSAARAELLAAIPLGPNFDDAEWDPLPYEMKKAILLDDPSAALAALGLPERRAAQLGNLLFRTELMESYSEYAFYVARSCRPDLAREFADLSTVNSSFWDRANAYLKNRFAEADPAAIDRLMRAGRARTITGRPRWSRDSKPCTENPDRLEKDLRAQLEKVRASLTDPLENLDAVMDEPIPPP